MSQIHCSDPPQCMPRQGQDRLTVFILSDRSSDDLHIDIVLESDIDRSVGKDGYYFGKSG